MAIIVQEKRVFDKILDTNCIVACWLSIIANLVVIILSHCEKARRTLKAFRWIISITAAFQLGSILTAYLLPFVSSDFL